MTCGQSEWSAEDNLGGNGCQREYEPQINGANKPKRPEQAAAVSMALIGRWRDEAARTLLHEALGLLTKLVPRRLA